MHAIPLNKFYASGQEEHFLMDALRRLDSGDSYYADKVSSLLEEDTHAHKVFMTTSCTHALEIAARLIGLKAGDEVIMPSFTFPSTANAVVLQGATPVFADIQADTLNLDPSDLAKRITARTKAIIPVHYAGNACAMDEIMRLAESHKLHVLEDAAQAYGSSYKHKALGTWGHLGCYSFHRTKNYTAGEGGALVINQEDSQLLSQAEIIINKGTDRQRFLRQEVNKYSWVGTGSNYTPSEIQMALLCSQLEAREKIRAERKEIYDFYLSSLQHFLSAQALQLITIPAECQPNYHLFVVLFPSEERRDKVQKFLNNRGIGAAFHFLPLHTSPFGRQHYYQRPLPVTEHVSRTLLRLPLYAGMTVEERHFVVDNLLLAMEEI